MKFEGETRARRGAMHGRFGPWATLALALVVAPTAWAGQVNLRGLVDTESVASTISNTLNETIASTIANTINETISDAVTKTLTNPGSLDASLSLVFGSTFSGTLNETVSSTIANTVNETVMTSLVDAVLFTSQPADVSIELSQGTVNSSSPYNNLVDGVSLIQNTVDVSLTSGITQVNAAAGHTNVQVSANSVVDGGVLVALAAFNSTVANKELGHALLCAGCGMQNSNISYIEQIAGVAEAAAETSSSANLGTSDVAVDDLTGLSTTMNANVVTAIAIDQGDVNEFSPHDNVIDGPAVPFLNDVVVVDTFGITQVNAAGGASNVQTGYNNVGFAEGTFTGPNPL